MRALTLHRPWPWVIFHAPPERRKRVENRTWPPPVHLLGHTVAFHAGKGWDTARAAGILEHLGLNAFPPEAELEGVIGTVRLDGVLIADAVLSSRGDWLRPSTTEERAPFAPWFFGPFGWKLADERALATPIPCRGAQGLWRLPLDVQRQVEAQRV